MATSATTATFFCPVRGDSGGDADVLIQWALSAPYNYEFSQFLSAGSDNTVTFPNAVPRLCTIIPPTTSDATLTLKGNAGDTGVQLAPTEPTILGLAGLVSSIILTLGSGSSQNFKFRLL